MRPDDVNGKRLDRVSHALRDVVKCCKVVDHVEWPPLCNAEQYRIISDVPDLEHEPFTGGQVPDGVVASSESIKHDDVLPVGK